MKHFKPVEKRGILGRRGQVNGLKDDLLKALEDLED